MDAAEVIVEAIRQIRSGSGLFNHYESYEAACEDADAPKLRRHNLGLYVRSFIERQPADLWIAEAPSRYGARWSGVPFTHQGNLKEMAEMLGLPNSFAVPTRDPESGASRTSLAIWEIFPRPMPLLWNVVMLHPFKLRNGQIRNAETTREHHELCREFSDTGPRHVQAEAHYRDWQCISKGAWPNGSTCEAGGPSKTKSPPPLLGRYEEAGYRP